MHSGNSRRRASASKRLAALFSPSQTSTGLKETLDKRQMMSVRSVPLVALGPGFPGFGSFCELLRVKCVGLPLWDGFHARES